MADQISFQSIGEDVVDYIEVVDDNLSTSNAILVLEHLRHYIKEKLEIVGVFLQFKNLHIECLEVLFGSHNMLRYVVRLTIVRILVEFLRGQTLLFSSVVEIWFRLTLFLRISCPPPLVLVRTLLGLF